MYPSLTTVTTSAANLDTIMPFITLATPKTTFFSLPLEIRWSIYELLLPASKHYTHNVNDPKRTWHSCPGHRPKHSPASTPLTQLQTLLLVCRRMNTDEPIKQIFYRRHTFVIHEFVLPPLTDPFAQMVRTNNETAFLDKFSWTDTMPLMRNMIFKLGPPGAFQGGNNPSKRPGSIYLTARQQKGLPERMDPVDFEHHDGWCHTLRNLDVLGLHINYARGGEMFGFEEWLFNTLWSLVGALPGILRPSRTGFGDGNDDAVRDLAAPVSRASGFGCRDLLPPGPMIIVYLEQQQQQGHRAHKRFKVARRIVETVIPITRLRYAAYVEALDTPFLDRKRIASAWVASTSSGTGESTGLNQGLVSKALGD